MILFPEDSSLGQRNAIARLSRLLAASAAVRVGETSVVSTKVHMQDARKPSEVNALIQSDAGKTFYQRDKPGEVIHIDVFHSEGRLDPVRVALSLRGALAGLRLVSMTGCSFSTLEALIPYIDIQTGAGGGRLDGDLSYGREEGVLNAHVTHVHVTALNTPEIVASVFTIVAACEAAIEGSGLQLRKVRKVTMVKGSDPIDISDYQASSDSLLRNIPRDPRREEIARYRQEALARQAAQDVGSVDDALRLLEELSRGLRAGEFARFKFSRDKSPEDVRQALARSRLARFDGQKYTLTDEGIMALSYLREHSHEIEAYLRRLLWSLPSREVPRSNRKGITLKTGQARGRGVALPRGPGDVPGQIALAETIISRGLRLCRDTKNQGTGSWGFSKDDLRFAYVREKKGSPVILLIDASASMAGKRITAAKELARHLIVAGQDKISVVVFQDADVEIICDFTKNPQKLEAGLRKVQAQGLTPLARGLEKVMELSQRCVKKPLVLCITDGIPTVPSKTLSPIDDAIHAAKELARRGIRLGCIGLEPNHTFLKQMASAAKGSLYIVDELDASTLAAIARKERTEQSC
ncbi:MAG: VWA domain-containing protein [Candidatus Fermentithermobacillus carboniphilus]|uniref:VWA domain-containing protein n=1 Tax=Candidatus Fermentithermobacillus carboniphilus TaxID=3085328 RepID=A0AAT9LDN6_9FIRM|nr:MAG: VWA domain-containing protein [Candidatus Fermentithermobacillus carboniphilus]